MPESIAILRECVNLAKAIYEANPTEENLTRYEHALRTFASAVLAAKLATGPRY